MKRFFPTLVTLVLTLAALLLPATASAELSKPERKQLKKMLQGTLYMRIDAPCATGRHPFGVYKRPLVEVSPEGVNSEAEEAMTASWWHADSTYWGIRVNDPVKLDEIDEEDEGIEIELEGVGPVEDESTVILLVGVSTLADAEAAVERAFARVPLQDEHDDWPQEIKDGIAERRLMEGMTKRQAYYITGRPESFEKRTEDGKEVEIWHLRESKGMKISFFYAKAGEESGLPSTIRFVDGKLVEGGSSGSDDSFSID